VNSQLTPDFLACFAKLPDEIKEQARRCYRLWKTNSAHPSLHFKPVKGQQGVYSVRVGIGWRALGLLEDDTVAWFWIGSHSDYDKLI
jgi:hypothetical protein